jgi:mRNA interferase RelE/StbE
LVWTIEFEPSALKELKALGSQPRARILRTLQHQIAVRDDPRTAGSPLVGEWTGYWRFRVGDYRVIAKVLDEVLLISVVRVAHRREVYRG